MEERGLNKNNWGCFFSPFFCFCTLVSRRSSGHLQLKVYEMLSEGKMLKGFRGEKLPLCFSVRNHHNSQLSDLLTLVGELCLSSLGATASSCRCWRSCASCEDLWVKFLNLSWPQSICFPKTKIGTPVKSLLKPLTAYEKWAERVWRRL